MPSPAYRVISPIFGKPAPDGWTLKPNLQPLPSHRYECGEWQSAKVPRDYMVRCDARYYSVPHGLDGETVQIKLMDDCVKVYYFDKDSRFATVSCDAAQSAWRAAHV